MKQWEMKFDKAIEVELIDGLDSLEDEEVYACEIVDKIMEVDIGNGCMFCREDEKTFIINNWEKAGDIFDYLNSVGVEIPNPFYESGSFVVQMFYKGLQDLLDKSDFIIENWDDEKVCLDRETIDLILEEVGIEREIEIEQTEEVER